ncbi:MAG: TrmJ/YjtD family RNA methyltransferase [Acidobacteriaceae bacterium]|nr:TrmJ/YjtD family RNA methyltransferase [Acidobacteriaceae bacterium]
MGSEPSLRVVLVSPRNPLNIGAAARAMSNFGFTQLRLVNPYQVAFREARSAVKAHYILEQAQVFETLSEAIADCTLVVGSTAAANRDLHVPLYRLEAAATILTGHLAHSPAALLFGSEKFGLSNGDMSHCHSLLRIPTREEHGSMNLGQAVAICLYELRRNAAAPAAEHRFPPPPAASAEQTERFTVLLLDLLARSGYTHERTSESTELKIRRLVRRLSLPAADSETWLGILRQILWKLRQGDQS